MKKNKRQQLSEIYNYQPRHIRLWLAALVARRILARATLAALLFILPPHPRFRFIETPSPRNNSRVAASAFASGSIIFISALLLARINPVNILLIPAACLYFMGVLFARRAQLTVLAI